MCKRKSDLCCICLRRSVMSNPSGMGLCGKHKASYMWDSRYQLVRRKKRGKSIGKWNKIWPSQASLQMILEGLYADVYHEVAFPDLMSPKGASLRFDMCIPSLGILVEYNGSQHYQRNRYFHKTKKKWKYYLTCHQIKVRWAQDNGWDLVVFSPEDLPFNVVEVKEKLDVR